MMKTSRQILVQFGIFLILFGCAGSTSQTPPTLTQSIPSSTAALATATASGSRLAALSDTATTHTLLVDDFVPQPDQGSSFWSSNRLGGDRGVVGSGSVSWHIGSVNTTISSGTNTAVGVWTSLHHPITDCTPLNFVAVLPPQIEPAYQGTVTEIAIDILDGQGNFQVVLQNGEGSACPPVQNMWSSPLTPLTGGAQTIRLTLPDTLTEIQTLVWQVVGDAGDFVEVDKVALTAVFPQLPSAEQAFLWSYAMLLGNWNPQTGLTRDRASAAAGTFDNIAASGMQAAAAVQAWELGIISKTNADQIVAQTAAGLLALPRDSCGGNLWPHFAQNGSIIPNSEWSSIDTVIAAVALLAAQTALGSDTGDTESFLTGINWENLLNNSGEIQHGYMDNCQPITFGWHDFGTESWLVNFGMAAGSGHTAVFDHTPPTYNGSGFIDELAWLLLPRLCGDKWQSNWCAYSETAVNTQVAHHQEHVCYANTPLFGLSAAEIPDRSAVPPGSIYQAFGVGGETAVNDGTALLNTPVIIPHYAGMVAPLRPTESTALFAWLIDQNIFTPLNNVESLHLHSQDSCQTVTWNSLKGSWNLSLQTLGWGNALLSDNSLLKSGIQHNLILQRGYNAMRASHTVFLPVAASAHP